MIKRPIKNLTDREKFNYLFEKSLQELNFLQKNKIEHIGGQDVRKVSCNNEGGISFRRYKPEEL